MVAFLSKNVKNGGAQLAPGVPVRAGQVLSGRYRVEELVGCSATTITVTARHVHLRHAVTLKILTSYSDEQTDLVTRQVKKARIASRLRGEHVEKILDIGTTEDGMSFIATERLEGHTLASELESRGRLPLEEALPLALEICEGLAEAHAAGLVHGDLRTKNVLLSNGVLKLLDFGMASPIESSNDASATAWFGMPSYLAPEQIKDPTSIDARADIWAVGVILHELISGSLPFTADTVSGVLVAVCCDAAPLLSDAPYDLARLVHRCLEKDPEARPASVEELANELARFLGDDGKRASERVRVALAKNDFTDDDTDTSESISPMSVPVPSRRSSHLPLPLITRRRPWDQPTEPSQRVVSNRRQSRARVIALGTIVAATAIAAAAMISSPPSMPGPGAAGLSLSTDDDVVIPSSREPFMPEPTVRAMREAVVLPSPNELVVSAPTAAMPPHVKVPANGGTPPWALRPRTVRSGQHLPGWLPGGRDPSVIAAGPSTPKRDDHSPRPSSPPASLPASKTDDSYQRNLFLGRK